MPLTDVGQTFEQQEILLTGGNGFLGKVVLGLVLDRYPQFKHLHVLIRPRRGLTGEERFCTETLASPSLASIAEKRGKEFLHDKITVWSGDLGQTNCGLRPADLEQLAGRVNLIINCAGRVVFFPPVDDSFQSNVAGVENLVALAKSLPAMLVHVSTCYVCGEADGLIEETEPILGFYPRRKGPDDKSFKHTEELRYCRERIQQIYNLASPDGTPPAGGRAEIEQRLIALGRQRAEQWGWVNTYTYAKSLGEQVLAAEEHLDYAIVRPAIVESAWRFPFPGWIEGGRTAAPLVLMALEGMKDWPVRRDAPLEVVPVDLVASAILVVSALLLSGRHESVYQLGTADVNPIELERIINLLDAVSRKRRSVNGNRPRVLSLVNRRGGIRFVSEAEARLRRGLLQKRIDRVQSLIHGAGKVMDAIGLPGKKSLAAWTTALRTLGLRAMLREQTLVQYLPFILRNRYIFECENIRTAYTLISERDRELLQWEPERIDWTDYWINNQVSGIENLVQSGAVKD